MPLTRTERSRWPQYYTVVARGRGWLVAIGHQGRVVVRTAPGRPARVAAARALLALQQPQALAVVIAEEGPPVDQGTVSLGERPPLDDLLDDLSMDELDALERAVDRAASEDAPC